MDLVGSYFPNLTGMPASVLFDRGNPLVVVQQEVDGTLTIASWKVEGIAKPSNADLAAALAQPASYSASQLITHASLVQAKLLATGETFNVAASGSTPVSVLCDGTNNTRADLGLLALYGQTNPTGTKVWLDNNGVVSTLTGAELVTLATLAGNWISNTYAALATLIGQITAVPPTITTIAQIDAYAWPTS